MQLHAGPHQSQRSKQSFRRFLGCFSIAATCAVSMPGHALADEPVLPTITGGTQASALFIAPTNAGTPAALMTSDGPLVVTAQDAGTEANGSLTAAPGGMSQAFSANDLTYTYQLQAPWSLSLFTNPDGSVSVTDQGAEAVHIDPIPGASIQTSGSTLTVTFSAASVLPSSTQWLVDDPIDAVDALPVPAPSVSTETYSPEDSAASSLTFTGIVPESPAVQDPNVGSDFRHAVLASRRHASPSRGFAVRKDDVAAAAPASSAPVNPQAPFGTCRETADDPQHLTAVTVGQYGAVRVTKVTGSGTVDCNDPDVVDFQGKVCLQYYASFLIFNYWKSSPCEYTGDAISFGGVLRKTATHGCFTNKAFTWRTLTTNTTTLTDGSNSTSPAVISQDMPVYNC